MRCTVFLIVDYRVRIDWQPLGPLSIPLPETVSAMLERQARTGDGWRRSLAHWIREDWLADFDPSGAHGRPGRQ